MKRLTKKNDNVVGGYLAVDTNEFACVTKLGKLEDLEEEIGCPLDVVFKALKNGFYIEKHTELGSVFLDNSNENIGFEYYENHDYCCYGITWAGTDICFTKDYKKTWWLKEDKSE